MSTPAVSLRNVNRSGILIRALIIMLSAGIVNAPSIFVTPLSALKGWDAEATKVYGVNSIPHLMLINPDGSIAAKGMNEKELRIKLQELLK